MSFSASLKNDICRMNMERKCCAAAELAAIIRVNGLLKFEEEDSKIKITTENAALARRVFLFAKELFGEHPEIAVRKSRRLKKHTIYVISLLSHYLKNATKMNLEDGLFGPFKECCKRAYLRGAFLGGGSLSDPEKTYHLEIMVHSKETAVEIKEIMCGFDLNAKIVKRSGNYVVYVKEGEHIVDFLNIIGAHSALLQLENIRILKEMRNNVNRVVNCETANLEKTVNTSVRQIEKIQFIKDNMGFEKLPRNLKEIAELRITYNEATLKELGEMLSPPIGKSGVNHRLRKLEEIADSIKMQT